VRFCQPSSYLCRRCLAAASAVLASVALFSIMTADGKASVSGDPSFDMLVAQRESLPVPGRNPWTDAFTKKSAK
jgi:hypothetical protein